MLLIGSSTDLEWAHSLNPLTATGKNLYTGISGSDYLVSIGGVYLYIQVFKYFQTVLLTVRMCQLTDTTELSPTSSLKCQAFTDSKENDPFISKANGDIEVNIMLFY